MSVFLLVRKQSHFSYFWLTNCRLKKQTSSYKNLHMNLHICYADISVTFSQDLKFKWKLTNEKGLEYNFELLTYTNNLKWINDLIGLCLTSLKVKRLIGHPFVSKLNVWTREWNFLSTLKEENIVYPNSQQSLYILYNLSFLLNGPKDEKYQNIMWKQYTIFCLHLLLPADQFPLHPVHGTWCWPSHPLMPTQIVT